MSAEPNDPFLDGLRQQIEDLSRQLAQERAARADLQRTVDTMHRVGLGDVDGPEWRARAEKAEARLQDALRLAQHNHECCVKAEAETGRLREALRLVVDKTCGADTLFADEPKCSRNCCSHEAHEIARVALGSGSGEEEG